MSEIRVEIYGDRIRLEGWAGPATPAKCKEVGGGRWNANERVWNYPLELSTCRRFRKVFGDQLSIGPALNAWARQEVLAEAAQIELAGSHDAELRWVPEQAPRIHAAMSNRSYQRVAALFGSNAGSFGLLDEQGLGKTIETLATIVEDTGERSGQFFHLILCPQVAIQSVWAPEVRQWLGETAEAFAVVGTKAQREKVWDGVLGATARHVFVVANVEMVRVAKGAPAKWPQFFERQWDTVVVDESHRALIRTTGTPTQQRQGIMNLRCDRRIAVSGTPMRGKENQLWGTLNWLRPDVYTSYWNWVFRYYTQEHTRYSSYVLGKLKDGALDAIYRDHAPLMLRRTKAEVLPELPAKQYGGTYLYPDDFDSPHGVWGELEGKHRKQYTDFERNGSIDFADDSIIASGALAEYTRRKQLSSAVFTIENGKLTPTTQSWKFDWLTQKIEEIGDGGQLVVASQFTGLLNVFADGLREKGIAVHLLTGATPAHKRTEMVADFQSDAPSARVFFLNTVAGGVALTLDKADDLVILDERANPDDQAQVEDRIHRASRIHQVRIWYLRTLETQDEELAWVTAARADRMGYILDGARGIKYAKQLYDNHKSATLELPSK